MSSIETCLKVFLKRCSDMSKPDKNGEDVFTKQFWDLRDQTAVYRTEETFTTTHGRKSCNAKKNRYKDILPFDYTRVILDDKPGQQDCDYVNANFIKGATGRSTYIAAQGPLPQTVNDFWRMIWQYDVRIILMACKEYENKKHKCQRYWANEGEQLEFGNIAVTHKEENATYDEDFQVRQLLVQCGDVTRSVYHFHYTAWPDHGTPTSPLPILDMIALARQIQPRDTPHILTHCSAGCGRTGTMIVIDYAWNILKCGRLFEDFTLYDVIEEMRKQRISLVQSPEQYEFTHTAVVELYKRHLAKLDDNFYANISYGDDERESGEDQYETAFSPPSPDNDSGHSHPTDQLIVETMADVIDVYGNVEAKPQAECDKPEENGAKKTKPKPPVYKKPAHPVSQSTHNGVEHIPGEAHSERQPPSAHKMQNQTTSKLKHSPPIQNHEYADIDDAVAASADIWAEYAEVSDVSLPIGNSGHSSAAGKISDVGVQGHVKTTDKYCYANPGQQGKWELQHVALGTPPTPHTPPPAVPVPAQRHLMESNQPSDKPPCHKKTNSSSGEISSHVAKSTMYEDVSGVDGDLPRDNTYAFVDTLSRINYRPQKHVFSGGTGDYEDPDGDAPPVPPKSAQLLQIQQQSVQTRRSDNMLKPTPLSIGQKIGNDIRGLFNMKTTPAPLPGQRYSGEPAQVIFKGENMSFPNRIRRVTGGRAPQFPQD